MVSISQAAWDGLVSENVTLKARLAEAERAAQQLYEADDADSPVMLDAFIAWQDYCHKHGVSETVPADSAALQCTGCVGVTKPICGHFAEQDDGEGRVSHYCATCGHSNECHEPASTAHSAPAAQCFKCGHPAHGDECVNVAPTSASAVQSQGDVHGT